MSNYNNENLISISPSSVPAGTLAIKVGDNIFTAGSITIEQPDPQGSSSSGGMDDLEFFDWYTILNNN